MAENNKALIGQLLLADGIISSAQLRDCLLKQRKQQTRLCETLVAQGFLGWQDLERWLARKRGFASVDLDNCQIDRALFELIPAQFARMHDVVPIDKLGKNLTVGMAVPLDAATIGELEKLTGFRVKPLLCSMEGVRKAIARNYPDSDSPPAKNAPVDTSGKPGVKRLVERIQSLPTLPGSVQRVLELVEQPEISMQDVAAVLRRDPVIASKLLSVANSPAFSFNSPVKSIELAITLLGLRETYQLVTAFSVVSLVDHSPRFNFDEFWGNANFCANCATALTKARGIKNTGTAYTAGLLHDIGRLVLEQVATPGAEVDPELEGSALLAAEEQCHGMTHPEAGYLYARHLNLPEEICEFIRCHEEIEKAENTRELVATVQTAILLRRMLRSGTALREAFADRQDLPGILGLAEPMLGIVADIMRVMSENQSAAKQGQVPA